MLIHHYFYHLLNYKLAVLVFVSSTAAPLRQCLAAAWGLAQCPGLTLAKRQEPMEVAHSLSPATARQRREKFNYIFMA